MSFQVGSKIATFGELFATAVASEGFLTCMATHVDLEGARPHETLIALFTFEWSFTCVPSEVI